MAEKNNATCSICGAPYRMCLSCKDSMSVSPWKVHCDTAEHYKVFQVIRGYNTKIYTKDEAKNKLTNIDLSDKDSFRPHIKSFVDEILKEPVVEKSFSSRKKSYKVDKVEAEEKVEDVVDVIADIIETE